MQQIIRKGGKNLETEELESVSGCFTFHTLYKSLKYIFRPNLKTLSKMWKWRLASYLLVKGWCQWLSEHGLDSGIRNYPVRKPLHIKCTYKM